MAGFVLYPHSALSRRAEPRPVDDAMVEAGEKLLAAARGAHAYGLAAAHIGLVEPVVVVSVSEDMAGRDYRLMFAPLVIALAEETASGLEGSVSMPGIEVPVMRPVWTEISYQSEDGAIQSLRLEGFPARVALHEIDQMEGRFFLDRVSRMRREAAIRKFRKSQRQG